MCPIYRLFVYRSFYFRDGSKCNSPSIKYKNVYTIYSQTILDSYDIICISVYIYIFIYLLYNRVIE